MLHINRYLRFAACALALLSFSVDRGTAAGRTQLTANTTFYVNGDALMTNSATSSGNTLNFASVPAWVTNGAAVLDNSSPSAIPAGTTVASTTGTTVVLSANVAGAGVGSGDTIAFSAVCGTTGISTCGPGNNSVTAVQAESSATPFLTLQAAINAILTQMDWNGFRPTINLAHGSPETNYGAAACAFPQGTNGALFIQGDDTDPSAVVITAPNSGYGLYATHYCIVRLRSVTIADQGSSLYGTTSDNFGGIDYQNIVCNGFASGPCIHVGHDGHLELEGPIAPATDALVVAANSPSWLVMDNGGIANFGESDDAGSLKYTVKIAGGLTFSNGFINATGGYLYNLSSGTFTGSSFTGIRAVLTGPGFLTSGGVACNTLIPGSSPCQITQGFQDDAGDAQTSGTTGSGDIVLASAPSIANPTLTSTTTLTGGTLAAGAQAFALTATQPTSPTTSQEAVVWTITGAGSASQTNVGFDMHYAAGYTGSSTTDGFGSLNSSAGTGSALATTNVTGNQGASANANGTTVGFNIGSFGRASNGNTNAGQIGMAGVTKNSATNIGTIGTGLNGGTTSVQIGGWFSNGQTTIPNVSAALIADNGSQSNPVALFQVNGATAASIGATGGVVAGGGNTDEGAGTFNGATYYAGGTAGLASKTCTIAVGTTFTIKGGIVTATSGC